jgi:RNA-directed DNA polymerase
MPRLCSDRSRPYPERPVRQAVRLTLDSIQPGNMPEDRAGVNRGHISSPTVNEGSNPEQGKGPVSSTIAMNRSGGIEWPGSLPINTIPMNTCGLLFRSG